MYRYTIFSRLLYCQGKGKGEMKKISNTLIVGPDADPGLALTGVWKYKGEVCTIWCSGELCLKWLPISFNIEEKKVRMINWERTAIVKRLEDRKTRVKGMRNVEMWIYDPVVCWSQIVPGKESRFGRMSSQLCIQGNHGGTWNQLQCTYLHHDVMQQQSSPNLFFFFSEVWLLNIYQTTAGD